MTSVLFVWCRLHRDTSYRQGMHELLVPFIYGLEQDKLLARRREGGEEDVDEDDDVGGEGEGVRLVRELMDSKEVEADAYSLFSKLMLQMKGVYETKPRQVNYERKEDGNGNGDGKTEAGNRVEERPRERKTPVLRLCDRIQNVSLRCLDPKVHAKLTEVTTLYLSREILIPYLRSLVLSGFSSFLLMSTNSPRPHSPFHSYSLFSQIGIAPQLFMLKWLRLLFIREFHIKDVMILWDGVFADSFREQGRYLIAGRSEGEKGEEEVGGRKNTGGEVDTDAGQGVETEEEEEEEEEDDDVSGGEEDPWNPSPLSKEIPSDAIVRSMETMCIAMILLVRDQILQGM